MEPWQRDIIKKNLPALVELTNWNTEISTMLTSRNILSPNDVDSLDTCYRSTGKMACSQLLYSFLETRTTGFEGIASALHKARQTGAFNILLKECLSHLAEQRTFLLPSPPTSLWMLPRNFVSLEIFDYCVGDLLVFKGIEYEELCSLIKYGQRISRHWGAGEYMLLEGDLDFSEICKKAKGSVHLLEYRRDSGGFLLVQSLGHVFNICQFLQGNENEPIAIQEFLSTVNSDSKVRLVECDFEMWSYFRAELDKKNEESAFGFVGWDFGKIGKWMSKNGIATFRGRTSKELVQLLLDDVTGNVEELLSRSQVEELLSRSQVEECHLILGIPGRVEDEVLKIVKDVIHKICCEIPNIRVWILSCMEVWRLEREFRTRAWTIKVPERSLELLSGPKVISPAVQCELHCLRPILPNENPFFSSPPIVNFLKTRKLVGQVGVVELCGEIFASCVNTLHGWLGPAASSDILLELMKIGFRSLFPEHADIIQGGGIHRHGEISFVSEDIAAFAVAKLLVDDNFSSHIMVAGKKKEFVRNELFKSTSWESHRFKKHNVCGFIDHFLGQRGNQHQRLVQVIQEIVVESFTFDQKIQLIFGCLIGNFTNLMKIIFEIIVRSGGIGYGFNRDLMKVAVAFGDVPVLKYICQLTGWTGCHSDFLVLAAYRGDLSIVNTIFQICERDGRFNMRYISIVLKSCVENSSLDCQPIISQKKKIIDKLLEDVSKLQPEKRKSRNISEPRIHIQLLKYLIDVRLLNMNDTIHGGTSIVETSLSHLTPGEFHELVDYLASRDKLEFFKLADNNGWTTAHHTLINLHISAETLDIWKVHEVDFTKISNDGLSLLSCAILGNQSAPVLKKLLDCGADRNSKNKFVNGAVHLAAFYGNLTAIMVLSEKSWLVNEPNEFGYTPIHLALIGEAKEQFIKSLKLLLRSHAVVDGIDASGSTPLFCAATKCKKDEWLEAISLLIKHGASLQAKDNDGQNIVHRAASERSPKQYHELIQWIIHNSDGSVLKEKCDFKCSPLHYAVLHLELTEETLDLLLKYGYINDFDKHGNSVLMYAIRGGRDSIFLKMLMKKGARLYSNNREFTPLHQAAKYGNVDALQLFIERGIDVNSVTVDGETPLHAAFQKGHDKMNEIVSILLRNHADVNAKDASGKTPLVLAGARQDYSAGVVTAIKDPLEKLKLKEATPKTMENIKPPRVRFPLSLLPNRGE